MSAADSVPQEGKKVCACHSMYGEVDRLGCITQMGADIPILMYPSFFKYFC
jgi:hypothetical protein